MESCVKERNVLTFGNVFITVGLLIQVIAFIINDLGWFSLISGCMGVFAVVLCSQRRFISFPFSFLQLITYIWLSYNERLWAEVGINIFYFILLIFTLINWKKNYDNDNDEVKVFHIGKKGNVISFVSMIVLTFGLYEILITTNDSQPLLDAMSTGPAIVAQILMMLRCREQWIYWIIIDLISIVMWFRAGDACMVAQYVFWTANCIYGYKLWTEK